MRTEVTHSASCCVLSIWCPSVDARTPRYEHNCEMLCSFHQSGHTRDCISPTQKTNPYQQSPVQSKHPRAVNDRWPRSLLNELPNPHTRMESYQLLNSACGEEIRWGARRVPIKQMLISSGNKRPIQLAGKRVEETISLKANRCVRCTLDVHCGQYG